jgi:hypothetical protein
MSLLLSFVIIAPDTDLYSDFSEPFFFNPEDDVEFSFYTGPLADDIVLVDDQLNRFQDDDVSEEEPDYSFSFSIPEDAVAAPDQIAAWQDNDIADEEQDYSFSLALQDDVAVVADQIWQAFDDADDEAPTDDYVFALAPLSADFVAQLSPQYQNFDDYLEPDADAIEYSFTLAPLNADNVVTVSPIYGPGGGSYNFLNRRKPKREEDDPELEVVVLGKPGHETITGLVAPVDAAKERRRRIQLADDEWLMLN